MVPRYVLRWLGPFTQNVNTLSYKFLWAYDNRYEGSFFGIRQVNRNRRVARGDAGAAYGNFDTCDLILKWGDAMMKEWCLHRLHLLVLRLNYEEGVLWNGCRTGGWKLQLSFIGTSMYITTYIDALGSLLSHKPPKIRDRARFPSKRPILPYSSPTIIL